MQGQPEWPVLREFDFGSRSMNFRPGFPAGTGNTLIWTEYGNDFRLGFCQIDPKTGLCPRVEIDERIFPFSRPDRLRKSRRLGRFHRGVERPTPIV